MKPYFAKYLPVDGEVKDGDIVLIQGRFVESRTGPYTKKFTQKYHLFLCTKVIKTGDKVFTPSLEKGVVTGWDEDYKCWTFSTSSHNMAKPGVLFKAIGPISPDAEWVKEGDEFEESEVDLTGTIFYRDKYGLSRHHPWSEVYSKEKYHLVKGPCDHFH